MYKRADELQAEERDIQAKMAYRIKRTKETFKGDERFLMIREYYRINKYKPVYALKSSVSLLLQIPFFVAAYNLLSSMQRLQGVKFGIITDLGKEDSFFLIGSFPINILPILMTVINIISGIIYTKGQPLKAKIQVYGLAAVFLVLLYHSPAGLVLYWLLNNVFSLVKNILYKRKILSWPLKSRNQKKTVKNRAATKTDTAAYFSGVILMALLTGLLIPSSVVASSPHEFINFYDFYSPVFYIVNSMFLSFGCWVLWGGVFFKLMNDRVKSYCSKIIWIICGISAVDYMLFGTDLGTVSSTLQYQRETLFSKSEYLLNSLCVIIAAVVLYLVYTRFPKAVKILIAICILTFLIIGAGNFITIIKNCNRYRNNAIDIDVNPEIPLSANGKNVVVLMLDRASGPLVPFIFNERPELIEKFDGFTYYPNTISYGASTNFASPALFGGYEYTPERINARSDESLESKQNESLKVMPVIFGEEGYKVTVCDPHCAGYTWIPDLTIYSDYPEFNCFNTTGHFDYFANNNSIDSLARINEVRNRNFFCFSLMKISPLILQNAIYNDGYYNEPDSVSDNFAVNQKLNGLSESTGYDYAFLDAFSVLKSLPDITCIDEVPENTFLMMCFDSTHDPCLLQKPDYVPAMKVDNTAYDTNWVEGNEVNGKTMKMDTKDQVTHYHVNMATYIQLGEWFDYLRETGVYDNTRIILVSDHGWCMDQYDARCDYTDMEFFMPLLMVKDFNATGFNVCEDFMTNGDTPVLASGDLIDNPVNPFTGNPINTDAKIGTQTVLLSDEWNTYENNGNVFHPGKWYAFDGVDPKKSENWTYIGEH